MSSRYHSALPDGRQSDQALNAYRSEEHTSELQSLRHLVCRLLLEKNEEFESRRSLAVPFAAHTATWLDLELVDEGWPYWSFFFLNNGAPPKISPFPPTDVSLL